MDREVCFWGKFKVVISRLRDNEDPDICAFSKKLIDIGATRRCEHWRMASRVGDEQLPLFATNSVWACMHILKHPSLRTCLGK